MKLTFRDIANLIECVAMFYFIKGLSVFRIVTEPCAAAANSPKNRSPQAVQAGNSTLYNSNSQITGTQSHRKL